MGRGSRIGHGTRKLQLCGLWDPDQEANFTYLTGYPHPSATVLITFSLAPSLSVHHTLFIPPAVPEETMWSIPPPTLTEARAAFDSDAVVSRADLAAALRRTAEGAEGGDGLILHTLPLENVHPALPEEVEARDAAGAGRIRHETGFLLDALQIARITKSAAEVALIRRANEIGSNAHEVLMRTLGRFAKRRAGAEKGRAGEERTGREGPEEWEVEGEADGEAIFVAACRRQG